VTRFSLALALFVLAGCQSPAAQDRAARPSVPGGDLYVSLNGNDAWSGRLADPNADGTDGPFATIDAALKIAREARKTSAVKINLRGGTYFLERPLMLTPDTASVEFKDRRGRMRLSGRPLIFAAYKEEKPVLSGGRRITGFKPEVVDGRKAWGVELPEVKAGKWYFRQLWVNGERRFRARLPKTGLYKVESSPKARSQWRGQGQFTFRKGDIRNWKNLEDVELSIFHVWLNSHLLIKSVDERKREVICQYPTPFGWLRGASYRVENVFEAMTEPGEWYLERKTGKLHYLPKPGEKIETAEVIAPYLEAVVRIDGGAGRRDRFGALRFEGLQFSHNEIRKPARKAHPSPQASWHIPGAVIVAYANNVTFSKCRFEHLGSYALACRDSSKNMKLERCTVRDVGAGGIKIWHGCERVTISDCEIFDGGHVFHQGVGVLVGRAHGNRIVHNNIHDFDYSGISLGWNWGPGDNCYANIVERNHIYNIGRGMLSDMAGIYFLGVQTGTRVRFNVIHDVYCLVYGAWGLYGDGWASGILVENNLIYRTTTGAFHTNTGLDLQLRNNIFAFGKHHQLSFFYPRAAHDVTLERNIILSDGRNLTNDDWAKIGAKCANNIIWDLKKGAAGRPSDKLLKGLGSDSGTVYADPGLVEPRKLDFRLKKDSLARKMGFIPFDHSTAGPRPEGK